MPSSRRTVAAETEHLDVMGHVFETMIFGGPLCPPLDIFVLYLDRVSTRAAHEMMVVYLRATAPVDGLAVLPAHGIHYAAFAQCLKGSVHRRETYFVARCSQLVVQLLRAAEPRGNRKRLRDGCALASGFGPGRRSALS